MKTRTNSHSELLDEDTSKLLGKVTNCVEKYVHGMKKIEIAVARGTMEKSQLLTAFN